MQVPKKVLNQIGMSFLRFYVSIDNVYVWTKYTGWDPDVSVGRNQLTPGLDADAYQEQGHSEQISASFKIY